MKKYFIFLLLTFTCSGAFGQTLTGKIINEKNEPLPSAVLFWFGTSIGTTTSVNGTFEIQIPQVDNKQLIVSLTGYRSDTIFITTQTDTIITLHSSKELKAVTITGQQPGQYISSLPAKTEVITSTELKKGACCDLAGCFNTSASVQPATTNIITNAQELRILGLSGTYNQVLIEGFPVIQGLTYTYGISSIPGPLVENIFVSKGANSVLQGWESISGQINVETKEPDKANKFFFNAYLNSFWEKQFNVYGTVKKNRWSNLLAGHAVLPAGKFDQDHDGFLDLPLLTRYEVYNKLKYGNETDFGWSSRIGVRFVNEQRIGGQTFFNPSTDKGTTNVYGQTVNYNQPEFWSKTAYRFNENSRFVFFASGVAHDQHSWFGLTRYDARQYLANVTLQYEWKYKNESVLKTGISYRYMNLDERISFVQNPLQHTYAGEYTKLENIPGVFAENTLYFGKGKFTWIAGMRLDHHNRFGFYFTPRTLLKYSPAEKTAIRISAGTGWRTVNIFSENIYLLASSRDVIFTGQLKPEQAINCGISFTQQFEIKYVEGTFSADFYRTQFQNQIFPDYDTDPSKAYIGNFTGTSVSNGFQAELSLLFYERLTWKIAYNYLDVYRMIAEVKNTLPFNPKDKLLNTISFKPVSNKWHVDANIHWYGKQKLPFTGNNPAEYQRPDFSESYTTANIQIAWNFKKVELYGGCENVFDFRQQQPILGWQDPFGPYFDTSSAWGPTRGREFYIGVRLKFNNSN